MAPAPLPLWFAALRRLHRQQRATLARLTSAPREKENQHKIVTEYSPDPLRLLAPFVFKRFEKQTIEHQDREGTQRVVRRA